MVASEPIEATCSQATTTTIAARTLTAPSVDITYAPDTPGADTPRMDPEVESLAQRLYDLCGAFADLENEAQQLKENVWPELQFAFATATMESFLAEKDPESAQDWRPAIESWISDRLQEKAGPSTSDPTAETGGSTTPQPQPPDFDFGLQLPTSSATHLASPTASMVTSAPHSPFPSFPSFDSNSSGSPFSMGHSPSSSLDSPLHPAPQPQYPNQLGMPSPFLQPFQFQGVYFSQGLIMGPNGVPMQIPVAVAPTTPMHTPVNPFDSSASPSRSSSLGTASPFGELEVDHQQWNADMNASLMHFQNSIAQQPAVLPSMTDIPRRSSPISMLPQLITTDLSPHNTNGFCQSPTINISRSPTPDPTAAVSSDASEPPHHARSRSLSASGPSTPTNRERGERGHHHRRLSSGTVSPRYHPFSTVVKSESASSLLQPDSLENEHLSPSAMMNELQLSAPSPASSTTSSQGRSSHRRSRSSETRSRAQRTIAYDENAVFLKNEKHVFVVHTQTRLKAEITEQDVLEIDLDTEDDRNATDSALWQAVHSELLYTNETLMQDCANQSTYHLVSNRAGATTRWEVSFSLDTSSGTPLPSTSIVPTTAILGTPANPTYTFVHFRPGEIVVNPTYPVGSSKWWRVQECNGRHENCPGDGSWTARWDEEGEARRPSRVVQHYATCALRRKEGDFFSLGKLARAVRTVKPKPRA